ncbi:hypothetical protein CWRG_01236 [Chthonomonas calidirosea]|uniref:Uncharacterized protein n=1 Tax=Chthonomonas calidirosea (strain DSM 23976 / ICMP 18418 / T49) TaxID=1303518 RepID=S0EXI9_CHTCT|nr:hypothetical protein CCALI_02836 [Chthonomonas calidirosea T49]CEK15682.1 hypothetical protein CWRG_01236 [Chthonomonas calidirosea]CEK15684.1 hypothetical protein CP488_01252 [Chthonomonas calidirosea]CEK16783.1 hypothetical protein CTKA_01252 [Chthonomonas calidirosea]
MVKTGLDRLLTSLTVIHNLHTTSFPSLASIIAFSDPLVKRASATVGKETARGGHPSLQAIDRLVEGAYRFRRPLGNSRP